MIVDVDDIEGGSELDELGGSVVMVVVVVDVLGVEVEIGVELVFGDVNGKGSNGVEGGRMLECKDQLSARSGSKRRDPRSRRCRRG